MARSHLRFVKLMLAGALVASSRLAAAQGVCLEFPVTNLPGHDDVATAAAFGSNVWLVAFEGGTTPHHTGVQLVTPAGTPAAPLATLGFDGHAPVAAFGAGTFLVVAGDSISPGDDITGQFVSPSGTLGAIVPISADSQPEMVTGIAFDGANFLVVYTREINLMTMDSRMYGRLVSPGGVVSSEIAISSGLGDHAFDNVAFDGTNYLVVWVDDLLDAEVRARFVTPAGTLGSEFVIDATPELSDDQATLAFNGTDYLVVFEDVLAGSSPEDWDIFARRVSTSGVLLGSRITVTTALRAQVLPFVASNGSDFLVTWSDLRSDLNGDFVCDIGEGNCADIRAQLVSGAGVLLGSEFMVHEGAGDQFFSPTEFGAGKYLVAGTNGSITPGGDIVGAFCNPAGCATTTSYCYGDGSGTACPCGNAGVSGRGCASSVSAIGALLVASGQASVAADTLVLTAYGMPSASVLYFQGTAQAGAGVGTAFGDGLRCASGTIIRLGSKNNIGGISYYPNTGTGDVPIAIKGLVPLTGGTRTYQAWYRNAAVFCTASTFNLTNGMSVQWGP